MAGAGRRWQVRSIATCHLHTFPEGIVLLNTADKRSCYLPGLAGAVFALLLQSPAGLDEAAILSALQPAISNGSGTAVCPDELGVALSALEAQRLIGEVA